MQIKYINYDISNNVIIFCLNSGGESLKALSAKYTFFFKDLTGFH